MSWGNLSTSPVLRHRKSVNYPDITILNTLFGQGQVGQAGRWIDSLYSKLTHLGISLMFQFCLLRQFSFLAALQNALQGWPAGSRSPLIKMLYFVKIQKPSYHHHSHSHTVLAPTFVKQNKKHYTFIIVIRTVPIATMSPSLL